MVCEESVQCSAEARRRIEELRSLISVDAILKMSHKQPQKLSEGEELTFADLPSAAQKIVAMIPDNAKRTAVALLRMRVNFRKALIEGTNPIKNQKPLSVSVLFDLLLTGSVSRAEYMMTLREKLGHAPTTAASQASVAFAIVTGLGIAKIEGEKLIIRS